MQVNNSENWPNISHIMKLYGLIYYARLGKITKEEWQNILSTIF